MKYLLLILLMAGSVSAQTFTRSLAFMGNANPRGATAEIPGIFVDSVAGSDSNAGTSNAPFATALKVNQVFTGTTATNIYFKRGGKYGTFRVPTNSTVDAYGTANYAPDIYGGITNSKPVFSGALHLTNANFTLTSGKTNTYQIALTGLITPCTNAYASLITSNVLLVTQNNSRLAGWNVSGSPSYAYTKDQIDGGLGRFFYDASTKLLYVSATNQSSIITNGGFFEAVVSTLLIHGGDNVIVKNLIADKCYAYDSSGSQGYGIFAFGSGLYQKCVSRIGWNHNLGVANSYVANPLMFDSCYGSDINSANGTVFVGYKDGASVSTVIFSNCLAALPIPDRTLDIGGYLFHDTGSGTPKVSGSAIRCTSYNMGIGYATRTNRVTGWYGNTAANCKQGLYVDDPMTVLNYTNYYSTSPSASQGIYISSGVTLGVTGSTFIFTNDAVGIYAQSATAIAKTTNCIFAATGTRAGYANQLSGTTGPIHSWSNSFNFVTLCYVGGTMTSGDGNNYYNLTYRIGEDMANPPSPGFWSGANLSGWKSAWSPIDANATSTNPGYAPGFYTFTLVDPTGGDAN